MTVWFKRAALAASGLLLIGCAPPGGRLAAGPEGGRTCFLGRNVQSWAAQGIDKVNIKVHQDYFRLNLAGACPEIQDADRIKLVSRTGFEMICLNEAANAEVTAFSKLTGPRRCLVSNMQRLTPAEVASLSKSEKP